jgi:hypothetical protein
MCRSFPHRWHQTVARLVLIPLVGALVGACAAERPERQEAYVRPEGPAVQTLSVPFDAGGRRDRVELRPEETLVVRLESRGGPAYQWELAPDDPEGDVVSVIDEPRPTNPPAGTSAGPQPKWDVFTFRALRPGATTLHFNHGRLAEPDTPPTKRSEVRVEVKP